MFLGISYGTWALIGLFIASTAISILTRPKPNTTNAEEATMETPQVEEGGNIPVLFGTREFSPSLCLWQGDVEQVAIVKKGGKK